MSTRRGIGRLFQEENLRNSPNRIVATVFGAVYLLVGLLGFAVTGGIGFIATEGGLLLGLFAVNPLVIRKLFELHDQRTGWHPHECRSDDWVSTRDRGVLI